MNPDTIHFHHLVIQRSGSYLATLFIIFRHLTSLFSVFSIEFEFSQNSMIFHLSLLFLFILTPPARTYVKLIWDKTIPFYNWQKILSEKSPEKNITIFLSILTAILTLFVINAIGLDSFSNLFFLSSLLIIIIFCIFYRKDVVFIPAIQSFICLVIIDLGWVVSFGLVPKLLSVLVMIFLIVFALRKKIGTAIFEFSALDILLIFIFMGSFLVFRFLIPTFNIWLLFILTSIWFSIGQILRRIFLINFSNEMANLN